MSHPSRVRGLKFFRLCLWRIRVKSHPSRVRGLKCQCHAVIADFDVVAPFTGAWIEILPFGTI